MAAAVVLVCGFPSSGKSSLCAALEEKIRAELDVEGGERGDQSGEALNDDAHVTASSFRRMKLGQAEVTVIDESSLLPGVRNDWFSSPLHEKRIRDAIRSALERTCSRSESIVIVDAMNAIKGFRYELYCIARSSAARYVVVHCDVPKQQCVLWNERRQTGLEDKEIDAYSSEVMEDLCSRFERPDARFRWESPLYTVDVKELSRVYTNRLPSPESSASEDSLTSFWDSTKNPNQAEQHNPDQSIVDLIIETVMGRSPSTKQLTPGSATTSMLHGGNAGLRQQLRKQQLARASKRGVTGFNFQSKQKNSQEKDLNHDNNTCDEAEDEHEKDKKEEQEEEEEKRGSNIIQNVDLAAQEVCNKIMNMQKQADGSGSISIHIGSVLIVLRRQILLPELRRHKRTFISICTGTVKASGPLKDPASAFAEYLRTVIINP